MKTQKTISLHTLLDFQSGIPLFSYPNSVDLASFPKLQIPRSAGLHEIKTTWHPIENIGGATSSY
jgi:hypothetical protein